MNLFPFSFESVRWSSPALIMVGLILFAVWFGVLVRVLIRDDLDPVTRFMWVFVVVSLNLVGVILYAFCAPPWKRPSPWGLRAPADRPASDDYEFKPPI